MAIDFVQRFSKKFITRNVEESDKRALTYPIEDPCYECNKKDTPYCVAMCHYRGRVHW